MDLRGAEILVLGLITTLGVVLYALGAPFGFIALICGLALAPYAYEQARRRRPGIEDWAALAVSLAFTAIALVLLLATPQQRPAVVTLAFFGGAALLFATLLVRKRRARKFRALSVSIDGGRDIRAGEGFYLVGISLGLIVVGPTLFFVGIDYPWPMRGIGAFMALVGILLLALKATGLLGRQFLRFEPEGLVFGQRRFEFRLAWDNIAAVAAREFADNPVILIAPADAAAIDVTPAQARGRLYRHLRQNNDWLGAPVVILPWTFGLEVAPLVAALQRYRAEPAARHELARRKDAPKSLAAPTS